MSAPPLPAAPLSRFAKGGQGGGACNNRHLEPPSAPSPTLPRFAGEGAHPACDEIPQRSQPRKPLSRAMITSAPHNAAAPLSRFAKGGQGGGARTTDPKTSQRPLPQPSPASRERGRMGASSRFRKPTSCGMNTNSPPRVSDSDLNRKDSGGTPAARGRGPWKALRANSCPWWQRPWLRSPLR